MGACIDLCTPSWQYKKPRESGSTTFVQDASLLALLPLALRCQCSMSFSKHAVCLTGHRVVRSLPALLHFPAILRLKHQLSLPWLILAVNWPAVVHRCGGLAG